MENETSKYTYSPAAAERFVLQLLEWFYQVKRDLPWRRTRDPYAIWVSEIMLQQTRVDTVIPYYERFLTRFPSAVELADAPEEDVLKHWEGLGYYSRVRNLQAAAKEVKEKYAGIVPEIPDQFAKLKGIGSYTKGAVMSIAYRIPEPAVDGNVMRVISRWVGSYDDIALAKTKVRIEDIVRTLIPPDQPGDFNQALMELGSQVCTPKSPSCEKCPVRTGCVANQDSLQKILPVKTKLKADKLEQRDVFLVTRIRPHDGATEVLVRQRPAKGLLAKLWEFPHWLKDEVRPEWMNQLITSETILTPFWQGVHVFSHLKWELRAYQISLQTMQENEIEVEGQWFGPEERDKFAFAQAFTVIWHAYIEQSQQSGG